VLAIARAWLAMSDKAEGGAGVEEGTNRFITLWIAFNALYAMHFDDLKHDSEQVRAFSRWSTAMAAHQLCLENPNYTSALADLAERGVYNYKKKRTEQLPDHANLEQVMVLVYQVRCNLFHGRKCPTDLRDQTLIRAAHTVIRRLVVTLLDRELDPRAAA
jgi:hypothetical protein